MPDLIKWPLEFAILIAAMVASGHAIVYKRDSRAAMLWTLVIWLLPIVGPALYFLLGIKRSGATDQIAGWDCPAFCALPLSLGFIGPKIQPKKATYGVNTPFRLSGPTSTVSDIQAWSRPTSMNR